MRCLSFKPCCALLAIAWVFLQGALPAGVVITEIMYHSPRGDAVEFVEIHNPGAETTDISGWAFTSGVQYTFPDGTQLAAGAFRVVCKSRDAMRAAYPALDPAMLLGDYSGDLANEGEEIALSNGSEVTP